MRWTRLPSLLMAFCSIAQADTATPADDKSADRPMVVELTPPSAVERASGSIATFRVAREPLGALMVALDDAPPVPLAYDVTHVRIGASTVVVPAGETRDFEIRAHATKLQRIVVDGEDVLFRALPRETVKLISHPCSSWDLEQPRRKSSLRSPVLRIDRATSGGIRLRTADTGTRDGDWSMLVGGDRSNVEFRLCGTAFVETVGRKARLKMEPGANWILKRDLAGRVSGDAQR